MDKAQLQSIISFGRGAAYFKGPEVPRALTLGVIDAVCRVSHCCGNHLLQSTEHRSLVTRRLAKDEVQKCSRAKSSRLIKSRYHGWQRLQAGIAPRLRTVAKELQQVRTPDPYSLDRRRHSKTARTSLASAKPNPDAFNISVSNLTWSVLPAPDNLERNVAKFSNVARPNWTTHRT